MTILKAIAGISLLTVLVVLYLAGKWKLFEKMGLAGWKSLIPVYSEYLIYKKAWCGKAFFASLFTTSACVVLEHIAVNGSQLNLALALASLFFGIASFVIDIKVLHRLAKSFGHGVGYTLGLLLAEPVFLMIMGFGKNDYARA